MNLHDWIDEVCDVLDIEEADLDEGLILDVAREAAHNVARPAAPITTFLLGFAAARSSGDVEETERLAGLVMDLAQRWDRPAGAPAEGDADVPLDDERAVTAAHESVDGPDAEASDDED